MNKLQKFLLALIFVIMAGYIAWTLLVEFYESQKNKWIRAGVNAVGATVQQKGSLIYYDKDGKEILTLIRK